MKKFYTCEICKVTSETKDVFNRSKYGMCLCPKHAGQMRRHGRITDPTSRTTNDKNEIVLKDDHAEMIIRDSKNNIVAVALIDLEDVEKVSARKWNVRPAKGNMYVYSKCPETIKLHRFVTGYRGPLEIDHINRNVLDNRKANLRIATRSENASNTDAKHIYQRGNSWYYEVVRYGRRFTEYGFSSYEDASRAFKKCLSDVSSRVNELIDQFNEQAAKNPYKGVYYKGGKYVAEYSKNNKTHRIGTYNTPEEANAAREAYLKDHNL